MHPLSRLGLASLLILTAAHAANAGIVRNAPVATAGTSFPALFDLDESPSPAPISLTDKFEFTPAADDAEFAKIVTPFGDIYIEFLPEDAPLTVANFKSYLTTASTSAADLIKTYDDTFVHRSIPGFVIQTGGYKIAAPLTLQTITPKAPITNEFKVANTRGTLAMAKVGPVGGAAPTPETINSATKEWFINLGDNRANLDNQNGGFTVFARVLGDGMTIADRIAALPIYDVDGNENTFNNTPLLTAPGNNLNKANFVNLTTLRTVASNAVPASAKTLPLAFSITGNTRPQTAGVTINADRTLTITPGKSTGVSRVTLRVQAIGGHHIDVPFDVVRAGPPTVQAPLPGTSVFPFGTAATLIAETSVWPLGTIRWERKAPGSRTVWTAIADDDPLFTGASTNTLALPLNDAVSPAATFTALQGSLFRFVVTNALGSVTSKPTKLNITTQKVGFSAQPAPLLTEELGDTATFSVTALPVATNTPLTYTWERLPLGQKIWLPVVNSSEAAPTPFSGAHTATLKVKLDDLALDGTAFRCVASNALKDMPRPVAASGTAITKPATLRIIAERRTLVTAESGALFGLAPAAGVSFSAKGLPKGLVLDPATGVLSGTALAKPGIYRVTVSTRRPSGTTTQLYHLEIAGLSGKTVGGFEAFLTSEDQPPVAKLALLIANTGAFTGTLATTAEAKPLAFRGTVLRSTSGALTLASPIIINRPGTPKGLAYRLVDFQIDATGKLTVALESRAGPNETFTPLASAASVMVGNQETGNPGVQLSAFSRLSAAPWSKDPAYTLALTEPAPLDPENQPDSFPAGSGYATALIAPDGKLALRGKLADGAPFTAALASDTDADYRLFVRPYGAATGAFLIAELPLTGVIKTSPVNYTRYSILHDLTNATPAQRFDDGAYAFWQKPGGAKTPANYREGFGPLGLRARLEPWLIFDASDLGLSYATNATSGRINFVLGGEALSNSAPNSRALPTAINVRFADVSFVDANLPDPSGLIGKLNTKTGYFSGRLTLTDPGAKKRVVPYEGVFLTQPALSSGTVTAEGFTLVPALSTSPASVPSAGRVQMRKP